MRRNLGLIFIPAAGGDEDGDWIAFTEVKHGLYNKEGSCWSRCGQGGIPHPSQQVDLSASYPGIFARMVRDSGQGGWIMGWPIDSTPHHHTSSITPILNLELPSSGSSR